MSLFDSIPSPDLSLPDVNDDCVVSLPEVNAPLMAAFLRLLSPNTRFSCRFVPQGVLRARYDTSNRKQKVLRRREGSLPLGSPKFLPNGGDLVGLPLTVNLINADLFLRRGDLLGVYLVEDGRCSAVFIDLDRAQVTSGGLPKVLAALDAAGINHLVERSSSGDGFHVWVIFPIPVTASKAMAWVTGILTNAGLQKKGQHATGDFDEVKPTGGAGGVVIPPHFLPGGLSSLVRLGDDQLITLTEAEAHTAIAGFKQRDGIVIEVEATVARQKSRRSRSAGRVDREMTLSAFRTLTEQELGDEVKRLQFVIERNETLQSAYETASSEETGKRSEAAWMVLRSLLIEHGAHPEAVVTLLRAWPRYKDETSLREEVFRVLDDKEVAGFLEKTSVFRSAIDSVSYTEKDPSCSSGVGMSARDFALATSDEKTLVITDVPPGGGKSTLDIPQVVLEIVRSCDEAPSTAIYRERKEDCLAMESLLNEAAKRRLVDRTDIALLRERVQTITPESYRSLPAGETAAATFAYTGASEHCILANGSIDDHCRLKALKNRATASASTPCASGCPRTDCRQHPGFLKARMSEDSLKIVVAPHTTKRVERPLNAAFYDERPQHVIRYRSIKVLRGPQGYECSLIDPLIALFGKLELREPVRSLKLLRRKLVDAHQAAARLASDSFRIYATQSIGWATADVEQMMDSIGTVGWERAVDAAKDYPRDEGTGLREQVRADLEDLAMLFSGSDTYWRWTKKDSGLWIHRAEVNWQCLTQGATLTHVFDGTAAAHYAYSALPTDMRVIFERAERRTFPNMQLIIGDGVSKGRGTERVSQQIEYAATCLNRLWYIDRRDDVLIVTHKGAVNELVKSLKADLRTKDRWTVLSGTEERPSDSTPCIWVAHFGALKGSNKFRGCANVIVTHKHNLPPDQATAVALALFPTMRVSTANGDRVPLPRQWTPVRRGTKGGAALKEPALFSHHFDATFSTEVAYVMRSHVATETVQAVLRSQVRARPHADVAVFIPTGDDTALTTMILRELPGANFNLEHPSNRFAHCVEGPVVSPDVVATRSALVRLLVGLGFPPSKAKSFESTVPNAEIEKVLEHTRTHRHQRFDLHDHTALEVLRDRSPNAVKHAEAWLRAMR